MQIIVVATAILTEVVVADMAAEVMSTVIQVAADTLTAVDMVVVAMVVELAVTACLTLELDFRNKTGVSQIPNSSKI